MLCGGSGTRLWPLSRERLPKQFLNLAGERSLLRDTIERALAIAGTTELVSVTLEDLKPETLHQLGEASPELPRHMLAEPLARDTAGAVALAAFYVRDTFGPGAIMWVMPADHHIGDETALARAVERALPAAEAGCLVTFGIRPTRAETGYGYIRAGEILDAFPGEVRRAAQFVEKPAAAVAESYLASGDYLWNSGMFLFGAEAVLKDFRELATGIYDTVRLAMDSGRAAAPAADIYAALPRQSFDRAVMEKSGNVAVVPCDPAWSDIGGWESLWEISPKDANGNAVEGRVVLHESANCIVRAQERLVACAGLENIVVAETGDAVLVADRRNGEAIKFLTAALKNAGQQEAIEPACETRPWGGFKVLSEAPGYKVKELTVAPGGQLSLQSHRHRAEFWFVAEGEALVTLGGEEKRLGAQESVFIAPGVIHRLANPGPVGLKIIEIQYGNYLGKDDIIRYEDIYGRAA